MTREEFEKEALKALRSLPKVFREKMKNVDVVVDESAAPSGKSGNILGLYQGIPVGERSVFYGNTLPDKITLFKRNIEAVARNDEEVRIIVKDTIIHEVGHHFGLSESEIKKAGY